MSTPSRRPQLLQAAAAVVRRAGAEALTLDAVAAEAGVSKGGLLYHFPTKDALIQGLLVAALDRFDDALRSEPQVDPGDLGRAYLRVTAEGASEDSSLIAVIAQRPELIAPMRARYAHWTAALVADAGDPVEAWVMRLTADGLWLADVLDLAPPDAALRAQILAHFSKPQAAQ